MLKGKHRALFINGVPSFEIFRLVQIPQGLEIGDFPMELRVSRKNVMISNKFLLRLTTYTFKLY